MRAKLSPEPAALVLFDAAVVLGVRRDGTVDQKTMAAARETEVMGVRVAGRSKGGRMREPGQTVGAADAVEARLRQLGEVAA